ncbi:hypothetical protein K505DRAFT_253300 [Melanomma pulvis-pyrius CBS 109.77]|uniref:MARVEL domain-containing protein n=1 Tax=Melanomma pulvis-pyrius CBS 109.77 TaxID=1314802 RepID=A0A6A6WZU3_9PLEO|nr:hypothetical protein K505DRAFT_253300 [Melanomma pulvis-pyrius CBS 109.77]
MTERTRPAHVLPVPRWTLIFHIIQAVFAVIVLGLDAYGINYLAYNALIFSLVVALLTIGICAYLLVSQLFLFQIYNMYAILGMHALMLLFWIVDLGLVANLARIWADNPWCFLYYGYDYFCPKSYYGTLVAGSLFAAVELVTFAASLIILVMHMSKHTSNTAATNVEQPPPPQYVGGTENSNAVPMEKYNQTGQPQQYQQPYSAAPTPQPTYAQPVHGQYAQQPQPVTYQPEPVNRTNTVSPVSHVGYGNASELSTPQPTGNYNPNVSELSTPQQTGNYNPNVSELSTTHNTENYHSNVSELSTTHNTGHYNPNVSELSTK